MSRASATDETVTPVVERAAATVAPRQRWRDWFKQQAQLTRRPRLESAWASQCGSSHARNQDAVCSAAPLFAVADGVGGGAAGEVASSELLAWCRTIDAPTWRNPTRLAAQLAQADTALAQTLAQLNLGGPSATTFVAAWLAPSGKGHIAHVGDSRVLRLQPQTPAWRVTRLTEDHTYASLGETPPPGGHRGDPARMVGVGAMGEPGLAPVRLDEGDWLLLCSDGLHRFVSEPSLARMCQQATQLHAQPLPLPALQPTLALPPLQPSPLAVVAQAMVQAALQGGSADDVSVLLVRCNPRWGARWPFWWTAAAALLTLVSWLVWPWFMP
jgi:PPM family protein phosphatase